MFVFALVAGFRDGAPNAERLRSLTAGYPVQAPDGVRAASAPNAAASVARWTVVARDAAVAPFWDADRRLLFAGDVRIYNRPELFAELDEPGRQQEIPDLELARLTYGKWGREAPAHLVGDFAFAAWNDDTRTLVAARDHLGVRPLFYRSLPDGIAVASDVRQLLSLVPNPIDELSHEQVLDGLLRRATDRTRTYFSGIVRVAPGHVLIADATGVRQVAYWQPPLAPDEALPYPQLCEELRALFMRAVSDRLASDRPIVAHSSGGFDSSTIVMAADRVYRADPGRPPLTLVSAVAPGFPSDESHYIDVVASSVAFPCIRWNVVDGGPRPRWDLSGSAPVFRHGLAGGPRRDLEVARDLGARVLLSGVLGDTVWHATGVRRDMVRSRRWLEATYDIVRAGLNGQTWHRFVDAGLGFLPPRAAYALGQRIFSSHAAPPDWLGPALLAIYRDSPARTVWPDAATKPPSHLALALWAGLTSPSAARIVEAFVEYAADDGIEVRAPYADVRLVEAVMRIPWHQREPRGHHRRTGRDALGPMLPAAFAVRTGQQAWTKVWATNARGRAMTVAPLIRGRRWFSAPFVDRGIARAMLEAVLEGRYGDQAQVPILVSDFGALEAWIRQLLRYNARPEVADAG